VEKHVLKILILKDEGQRLPLKGNDLIEWLCLLETLYLLLEIDMLLLCKFIHHSRNFLFALVDDNNLHVLLYDLARTCDLNCSLQLIPSKHKEADVGTH
jgi:hypothetical protein